MQSGKKVLKELNKTLKQARKHLDDMDHELETSAQALALNTRAQARTLRRLAEIRFEAIGSGEIDAALAAADDEARKNLEARESAIIGLDMEIEDAQAELDAIELERDTNHETVEAAALDVTEREGRAQSRLESDPEYTAALTAVRELDAQADACKAKASQAKSDERDKGEPYRNDPLFAYLWERNFGTSDYRANLLARSLDAWVAKVCSYNQARQNYWMLRELPDRLEEHAKALREEADNALIALWKLEKEIADEAGVEAAQKALKDAEAQQDSVDDRIVEAEAKLRTLLDDRGQFAAGEDRFIKRSLTAMAQTMGSEAIEDLLDMAAKTKTAEDDELVGRLEDLRDEERDLKQELNEHRDLHASYADRLSDLEDVRRKFKSARYDDLRSGFSNDALVGNLIGGILGGAIAGGALWQGLQRQQRFRDVGDAWPDFGSGGLMKKRKQSGNWHWPEGRDEESFNLPRSSRSRKKHRTRRD